jgi:uncharacterized protein (DUF1697 family)
MTATAVMLRAVNVGGRRLVMADFRAALEALGFPDARTVVATGNAVIPAAGGAGLEAKLETGLGARLGGAVEVFVRDGAELAAIMAGNPFGQMAREDPSHLVVMFLKGEPPAAAVAALRAKIAGPEVVEAGPGCLYVSYPDGIGTSKLTGAGIERALKLRGTARNWNTVAKLAALTG